MTFTVYNASTGQIRCLLDAPLDQIGLNVQDGDLALVGGFSPDRFYIRDGLPVEFPPRPSINHVWDWSASEWIDPRTPADLATELEARRDAAWLDKSSLLIALVQAGILTAAEADEAAVGIVPTSMAAMIAALPADAQMAARIKWAADTQISRKHPVIVAAAYALGVTDEALDEIFGVTL